MEAGGGTIQRHQVCQWQFRGCGGLGIRSVRVQPGDTSVIGAFEVLKTAVRPEAKLEVQVGEIGFHDGPVSSASYRALTGNTASGR